MKQSGVPMNTVTYNSALAACEEGLQWERALHIYAQIIESSDAAPDTLTFRAVMATCRATGATINPKP